MKSNVNVNPVPPQPEHEKRRFYVSVKSKFWISHFFAFLWMCLAIYLAYPWLTDLAQMISLPSALMVIAGITYIPGYMNAFLVASLILDKQPPFADAYPRDEISVLIAAHNEEDKVFNTLSYVNRQDYYGKMKVIFINNCSTD